MCLAGRQIYCYSCYGCEIPPSPLGAAREAEALQTAPSEASGFLGLRLWFRVEAGVFRAKAGLGGPGMLGFEVLGFGFGMVCL